MAKSTVSHRRNIRRLEAKRDSYLESAIKNKTNLATVRAELKQLRKTGAK